MELLIVFGAGAVLAAILVGLVELDIGRHWANWRIRRDQQRKL